MWIIVFMGSVVGLLGTSCHLNRLPDVHFEATPQNVVEEMLEMAKVTKEDMVYDLGCGDGRFVITAAKKFGAQGVGIDIDPKRVKESRENIIEAGVTDRVKIIEDDLFKTNISEATVITLYLLQDLNLKLRPKLLRELQPGSRVVSYVFHMGDWKPDIMKPLKNSTSYYYIWVIPADVAGIWRWNGMTQKGDQPYTLRLKQNFQEVSGHVTIQEGRRIRIIGAQLIGDRLNFVLKYDEANKQKVAMQFNGRVSGNTLHGNMEMIGGPLAGNYPWTARRNP
jgi:SAM-dependent methyltransferase